MKNVLVLVHDDLGQESRLQAALDLTRALGGHLHCLDVTLAPRAVDTPYGGFRAGILFQDERAREATNKEKLQERLRAEDVRWSWQDAIGEFDQALRHAALLADLIVVSRELSGFPLPDMAHAAGKLILDARRPILAVPDDARSFDASGRALIAWDGSPPAAAAMMAAMPLLTLARGVTLLEIGDQPSATPAEEAARYLAAYGIEARLEREAATGRLIEDVLLDVVTSRAPGYVVMGGYGHGRLLEAALGGATRTMLKQSPVPVFLAH